MGSGIGAVVFDLDDTLIDTRSAFDRAIDTLAREFLPDVSVEDYPALAHRWRTDPGGYYAKFTRGEISNADQRRLRAQDLHEAAGGPDLDEELFPRWNQRYDQAFAAAWRPFADAAPCVQAIRGSGLQVGALTNAIRSMQEEKLERCGLAEDVPLLVTLDTLGVGKPDPKVFIEACRLIGLAPERVIYVGDELEIDARGAIAAGMRGVWLDRPGRRRGDGRDENAENARSEGVDVIESLSELPALL